MVASAKERRENKSLKRGNSVLGRLKKKKKSIQRNEWIR